MAQKVTLEMPLNRVEGDLEIKVELTDGVVTDAWSIGTLFRGFERILVGRGAMDSLVIAPRICGLCSTAHLKAAVKALDMICGAKVSDNAKRVRNLALMTENVQSDLRQSVLMYMVDFCNEQYSRHTLYEEAVQRYAPLKGVSAAHVIRETKKLVEIIAILGGQWPHSSFMIPGGVASPPGVQDLSQCRYLLTSFRQWYERQVLGCSIDRWLEVKSIADLDAWLYECETHRGSDLGFFVRFAREAGLHKIGKGTEKFLSYGGMDMPRETSVKAIGSNYVPAGFATGSGPVKSFHHEEIAEHVAHSWFVDYEGGKHPFVGETRPYATGYEGEKYSWAKAPRYAGHQVETGPLAEWMILGDPLIREIVKVEGASAYVRELSRLLRPVLLLPAMETWINEAIHTKEPFYAPPPPLNNGSGHGLLEATRGALGHWVKVENGKITNYQVITPTAWNGSPRDSEGYRGPWEEALIGTRVQDADNPVEIGHVVRSFDPCLVCTVHMIRKGKPDKRALI